LLSPNGSAERVLVLGARMAADRFAGGTRTRGHCSYQLVVLRPSPEECRSGLELLVGEVLAGLAAEGVAYVLVPPSWRKRAGQLLMGHGLLLGTPIAHHPDLSTTRYLLPLKTSAMRYAADHLLPGHAWPRRTLKALAHMPSSPALLTRALPDVGIVATRPGSRPAFAWLNPSGSAAFEAEVVLKRSWRRRDGQMVLHVLNSDGRATSVAKVASSNCTPKGHKTEAETLKGLAPSAIRAGARVPEVRRAGFLHTHRLLVESVVPGTPAGGYLAGSPRRFRTLIERLSCWLQRWASMTVVRRKLTGRCLREEVLEPASLVEPWLPNGAVYLAKLDALCSRAEGSILPFVAVHGDLTMWNVLVDAESASRGEEIGIVDWEMARDEGLPLGDFLYGTADAAAAVGGYADRGAAFDDCFTSGGRYSRWVAGLTNQLTCSLGLSDALTMLMTHACWLGHAAREVASTPEGSRGPFVDIVGRLGARRI
ncbi:MAG TPA: phosphotransferase, partial [Gemmatimonadales bacterium]|nr:phosphotransferase [Gemmatimonadales bacterium]